jgi:hypothetical protein
MANAALAEFETAVVNRIDLGSLVKGAAESLELIEPWNHDAAK